MQRQHLAALVRRVGFSEEQPSGQKTKASPSRYEGENYHFRTSRGRLCPNLTIWLGWGRFWAIFRTPKYQELPRACSTWLFLKLRSGRAGSRRTCYHLSSEALMLAWCKISMGYAINKPQSQLDTELSWAELGPQKWKHSAQAKVTCSAQLPATLASI